MAVPAVEPVPPVAVNNVYKPSLVVIFDAEVPAVVLVATAGCTDKQSGTLEAEPHQVVTAPLPPPPLKDTLGADVYPLPPPSTEILYTPSLTFNPYVKVHDPF